MDLQEKSLLNQPKRFNNSKGSLVRAVALEIQLAKSKCKLKLIRNNLILQLYNQRRHQRPRRMYQLLQQLNGISRKKEQGSEKTQASRDLHRCLASTLYKLLRLKLIESRRSSSLASKLFQARTSWK